MTLIDIINSRRSIRKYTGEAIDEEMLKSIIQAGFQAPSAHNYQPQNFIVVKDKKTLNMIAEKHNSAKMLTKAGCAIVVCGDKKKQSREGLIVADCSASIQNMLLASHSLGLGAVWIGLYPIKEFENIISEILNIPENMIPVGIVSIGHKAIEKGMIDKYDEKRIHREMWNK